MLDLLVLAKIKVESLLVIHQYGSTFPNTLIQRAMKRILHVYVIPFVSKGPNPISWYQFMVRLQVQVLLPEKLADEEYHCDKLSTL